MIRRLIFPFIFCYCLSVAQSQDAAIDNSLADKTSSEQSQQETQGSARAVDEDGEAKKPSEQQKKLEEEKQQKKKPEAVKSKPPKEVFKPTEEISEDLPVPFPIDI